MYICAVSMSELCVSCLSDSVFVAKDQPEGLKVIVGT